MGGHCVVTLFHSIHDHTIFARGRLTQTGGLKVLNEEKKTFRRTRLGEPNELIVRGCWRQQYYFIILMRFCTKSIPGDDTSPWI